MDAERAAGRDQVNVENLSMSLSAAEPAVTGPPRQLPPDVPEFVDREELIAILVRALVDVTREQSQGPVAFALAGKPGVGKSALAIHAAHRVKGTFPDGQLYVNLRGPEGQRLEPSDVLDGFLRELGIPPDRIPATVADRATLYRSTLATRHVLVVLDNAANETQVRPLLPAGSPCAVLITSRVRLNALEGADIADLEVLAPTWSLALLERLVSPDRIEAEEAEARTIIDLCGGLPLAIRIVGARLKARPLWSLRDFAARLRDERRRLNELMVGDTEVRASLAISYQELPDELRQAFRSLGIFPGADFSTQAVAGALNQPLDDTESSLERLVDAQLLETPSAHRYRFHDLIRVFARERLRDEESGDSQDALLRRTLGWYAQLARLGAAASVGAEGIVDDESRAAVLAFVDKERRNLLDALEAAQAGGLHAIAYDNGAALYRLFEVRGDWAHAERVLNVALEAAEALEERNAELSVRITLGQIIRSSGRPQEAVDILNPALVVAREIGDEDGEMRALDAIGTAQTLLRDYDRASEAYESSLTIAKRLRDRGQEGATLNNLGLLHTELADFDTAVGYYEQSLEAKRDIGARRSQGFTYNNIGVVRAEQRRYADAITAFEEDLRICREFGDHYGAAQTLFNIGFTQFKGGLWEAAVGSLDEAATEFLALDDMSQATQSLLVSSRALERAGRSEDAGERLTRLSEVLNVPVEELMLARDKQDEAAQLANSAELSDEPAPRNA